MIHLRSIILSGLLSLPLLHSGFAHAETVGSYTGGITTLWTWDSFLVPLDAGKNTIVYYDVHAFNFVLPFVGDGTLAFEDSDNFSLNLNITNLGTAFNFTEVSGDGSNDFGQGVGLDVQLVAAKTNGVLSANGSIKTSPGSMFDTPWGVASVDYSLDILAVSCPGSSRNHFRWLRMNCRVYYYPCAIGYRDGLAVKLPCTVITSQ